MDFALNIGMDMVIEGGRRVCSSCNTLRSTYKEGQGQAETRYFREHLNDTGDMCDQSKLPAPPPPSPWLFEPRSHKVYLKLTPSERALVPRQLLFKHI